MMRIGILGSGLMGSKLGTLFARAGHEVVFSYARRQEKQLAYEGEEGPELAYRFERFGKVPTPLPSFSAS